VFRHGLKSRQSGLFNRYLIVQQQKRQNSMSRLSPLYTLHGHVCGILHQEGHEVLYFFFAPFVVKKLLNKIRNSGGVEYNLA
jgi:hypothetical protein